MNTSQVQRKKFKNRLMVKMSLFLCALMLFTTTPVSENHTVYAASYVTFSSTSKSILCGKRAQIKLPSSYKNSTFTSSNKKVATVSKRGMITTKRLGEATITAKSKAGKIKYRITVTPKKKNEVWLNQEAVFTNQKLRFKLESDKYDTSQVKLKFFSAYDEISSSGKCSGITDEGAGTLYYSYGSFSKDLMLSVYNPDTIFQEILNSYFGYPNVYADVSYHVSVDGIKPSQLAKKGIKIFLDGEPVSNTVVYTPGNHTLSLSAGTSSYTKEFGITYRMKDVLQKQDSAGFTGEHKEVLDAVFQILDEIIVNSMTDEQKIKAIHDYLIYHANYYNNGNYYNAPGWAAAAKGVILRSEGVCNSYAIAFYMMAVAAGLDCEFISGTATNSTGMLGGHAWNRVKMDDKWYYIDCTWDDPVGGGRERYTYYLSERLWANHRQEETKKLIDESMDMWLTYYLTGEGW